MNYSTPTSLTTMVSTLFLTHTYAYNFTVAKIMMVMISMTSVTMLVTLVTMSMTSAMMPMTSMAYTHSFHLPKSNLIYIMCKHYNLY